MTRAFVLGNGISRQHLNLAHLKNCGKIYGCNALYRDFTPDVLVATDKPIATQIQESGYALRNVMYTRRPLQDLGARQLSQEYSGFSSGPNALALAALDKNIKIYMLGFDIGPNKENMFNNIYAGTEFYKPQNATPTFTGNWVKQCVKIMANFPNLRFVRVYGETTAKIPELEAVHNLEHVDLGVFLDRINNQKDL